MLKNIKELFFILKVSDIKNFYILSIFILFNSLIEIISLGLLLPVVTSYVDDNILEKVYSFLISINIDVLKNFLYQNKEHLLSFLIAILLIIYTIKYSINILFAYYLSKQKIFYEKKIVNKLLQKLFSSSNLNILNLQKSEVLQHLNVRSSLIATSITNLSNLIVEFIVLISLTIFFLLSVGKNSLYAIIIFSLISFFLFTFIKNKVVQWSKDRGSSGNERSKNLIDILEGARELLIFGNFDKMFYDFKKSNNEYLAPTRKITFWNALPRTILEYLLVIFILFYFLHASSNDFEFEKAAGSIAIIMIVLFRSIPSLNRIIYHFTQLKYASEPLKTIKKLFDSLLMKNNNIQNKELLFNKELILKNIKFNYSENLNLFNDLNIKIKKNSKLAIIGETGIGKSTFIDLLSGLKRPNNGEIYIDDKLLNFNLSINWIQNIAYVSQRVYLFNSSIRNNITFKSDNEKIDDKRFDDVIKFVELENLIKEKKDKEFFSVGEFGGKVSGGQRQKIGIARAIYSGRKILIFDESTNSLDKSTENKIVKKISSLNDKTIIFITHSVQLTKNFEFIYKLENKKIINYDFVN